MTEKEMSDEIKRLTSELAELREAGRAMFADANRLKNIESGHDIGSAIAAANRSRAALRALIEKENGDGVE